MAASTAGPGRTIDRTGTQRLTTETRHSARAKSGRRDPYTVDSHDHDERGGHDH